jgi:RNA polymerase sigma factor (sigma-70 family)
MTGSPDPAAASGLVGHYFRHEYGRLVAMLSRLVGVRHVESVEDAVQAALMAALASWTAKGLPDDPGAWLYRVAHNHLLGALRLNGGRQRILERDGVDLAGPEEDSPPHFEGEVRDDMLRMLFVCCDEAIPGDSRLVLALKTLCGFGTAEIALRLFLSEANVHKRLARARERLRELSPDFQALPLEALRSRLSSVHTVLYLLFNEGYLSVQADRAVRRELCDDAIRLATLLAEHPVGANPETFALVALMNLHGARLAARMDGAGGLLLLEDQDRTLWDGQRMRIGAEWLRKAATGGAFTRYHAEAGIAAEHCCAPSFAETRWGEIVDLYAMLDGISPSPLNALNRAVAMAQWKGPEAGLAVLEGIESPPWLAGYHLWDAVLGDLHRRSGHIAAARRHLERALALAPTDAERGLLGRRLESLAGT